MPWKPVSRTKPRTREPRAKTTERGYGWDWQQLRARILPALCKDCEAKGIVRPATEVHHMTKIKHAPHMRLEEENLRPLCGECHQKYTSQGL